MNMILIVPIIYLVIEIVLGVKRGLIKSVLLLISWFVSVAASSLLVREFALKSEKLEEVSKLFQGFAGETASNAAALVCIFFILMIMIKIFCHILMHFSGVVSDIPVVGKVNRFLGGVFGLLKGIIVLFLVFLAYAVYSGSYVDILREELPILMTIVDYAKEYLQQMWMIAH